MRPNILDIINKAAQNNVKKENEDIGKLNADLANPKYKEENQPILKDKGYKRNSEIEAGDIRPSEPADIYSEDVLKATSESLARQEAPLSAFESTQYDNIQEDPYTWSPEYTQMSFLEKSGRSMMRGLGSQVIGGFGDMLQIGTGWLIGDIADGNMASRWLQEVGQDIANDSQNYTSAAFRKQMADNAWNIKTLMHPDFWSNNIAEGIPMLVEFILLSKGGAAGAKSLAEAGLEKYGSKAGRKLVRNAAEAYGKKTAEEGVENLIEVQTKRGWLTRQKYYNVAGKLTEEGSELVDAIGGGLTNNTLTGLLNAADIVNRSKNLTDENGNPVYTEKELANMASRSFTNNMKYVGIDALSFGLTYGEVGTKAYRKLNKVFKKAKTAKAFTPGQQASIFAKSFTATVKPMLNVLQKASKLSNVAFEAFEETFQETFEDWNNNRAQALAKGEDFDTSLGSYWEYYNSKQNEQTRIVSAALGGLGGGIGTIGRGIARTMNAEAETARKSYTAAQLLTKKLATDDMNNRKEQVRVISEQLLNNHLDGTVPNELFIQNLLKDNIVDEEDANYYLRLNDKIIQTEKDIENMNLRGKYAFLNSALQQEYYKYAIENETKNHTQKIANIEKYYKNDLKERGEQIVKENTAFNENIKKLNQQIVLEEINQGTLLKGNTIEDINRLTYVKDNNGEYHLTALSQDKYDDYFTLNDSQIEKFIQDNKAKDISEKSLLSKFKNIPKNLFNKIKNTIKKTNKNNNSEEEENIDVKQKKEKEKKVKEYNDFVDEINKPIKDEVINDEKQKDYIDETLAYRTKFDKELSPAETKYYEENKETIDKIADELDSKEPEHFDINEETENINKELDNKKALQNTDEFRKAIIDNNLEDEEDNIVKDISKQFTDVDLENEENFNNKAQDILDKNDISEGTRKVLNDIIDKNSDELNDKGKAIYTALKESNTSKEKIINIDEGDKKIFTEEELSNAKTQNDILKQVLRDNIENRHLQNETINQEDINFLSDFNTEYTPGLASISNQYHLNKFLRDTYPDKYITTYSLRRAANVFGPNVNAMVVGSTIFIDDNKWEQDIHYMHEFSHILYNLMPKSETEPILNEAKKNKKLVEDISHTYKDVPDVIDEEIFVNYLQGPLSEKYNKYFQIDRGKEYKERIRQRQAKSFWKKTKETFSKPATKEMLFKVSGNEYANLDELLNDVVPLIKDATGIVNIGELDSRKIIKKDEENILKKQDAKIEIDTKLKKIKLEKDLEPAKKTIVKKINQMLNLPAKERQRLKKVVKDNLLDSIEEERTLNKFMYSMIGDEYIKAIQLGINEDLFNSKNYLRAEQKSDLLLRTFYEENYKRRRQYAIENNENLDNVDYKYYKFKDVFYDLAHKINDPAEYIATIINMDNKDSVFTRDLNHDNNVLKEVKDLAIFLEKNAGDYKYQLLNSLHFIYSNTSTIDLISDMIIDGKLVTEKMLSERENLHVKNVEEYLSSNEDIANKLYNKVLQLKQYALNKNIPIKEAVNIAGDIISLMSNNYVNKKNIIESGYIYDNGQKIPLLTYMTNIVKDNETFKNLKPNSFTLNNADREIIKTIYVNNKHYGSSYIANSPSQNTTQAKQIPGALYRHIKEMNNDLMTNMSKKDFMKKYDNMPELGTNTYLDDIYTNYKKNGILPSLVMHTGIINIDTGNAIDYKGINADMINISQFSNFLQKGKTYSASVGIMGNSNRRFMLNQIKHEINEKAFTNGKYILGKDPKTDKLIKSTYDLIIKLSDIKYSNIQDFVDILNQEISEEIEYYTQNAENLKRLGIFNEIYHGKTLTKKGKYILSQYVINNTINSGLMHRTYLPNIEINNKINKIRKGLIAPVMAFKNNTKIIQIPIADQYSDNIQRALGKHMQNDSDMFVMEETLDKIARHAEGFFNLNHGLKLFNHKIETKNKFFKNKVNQVKGYTTPLTMDMVKLNPELAGFLKFANEQTKKAHAIDPDAIVVFTSISSLKNQKFLNNEQTKEIQNILIDNFNNPEFSKKYDQYIEKLYYTDNGEKIIGLDGSNFGVQQIMDKEYNEIKIPSQLTGNLISQAKARKRHQYIQELIENFNNAKRKQFEKHIDQWINKVGENGKFAETIRRKNIVNWIKNNTNIESFTQQEQRLLKLANTSILHPAIRDNINNFIDNQIMRYYSNYTGPGTMLQQKSEMLYKHSDNKHLKSYTTWTDINGDKRVKPVEVVLSKQQSYRRKRQVLSDKNHVYELIKKHYMDEFHLDNKKEINDFIENHKIISDGYYKYDNQGNKKWIKKDKIEYYIPGEQVLITRIPSSGIKFTAVAEIVDFDETGGNQVMVPTELKQIMGSDDDGDAIFVNMFDEEKGKDIAYNNFISGVMDMLLDPENLSMLTTELNSTEEAEKEITVMNKILNKKQEKINPFSIKEQKKAFNNSKEAEKTIGTSMNIHRTGNMLRNYFTEIKRSSLFVGENKPISFVINDKIYKNLTDRSKRMREDGSIENYISNAQALSEQITQIQLDSISKSQAEELGFNKHTIGAAMILANMGMPINEIGILFNHPATKEYIKALNDRDNIYLSRKSRAQIMQELATKYGGSSIYSYKKYQSEENKTSIDIDINPKSYDNNENSFRILQLLNSLNQMNNDIIVFNKIMNGHNGYEKDAILLEEDINKFNKLINNKLPNQMLLFDEDIKKDKELLFRLEVAKQILKYKTLTNLHYSGDYKQVLTNASLELFGELKPYNSQEMINIMKHYTTAKALGVGNKKNILYAVVQNLKEPKYLSNKVMSYKEHLQNTNQRNKFIEAIYAKPEINDKITYINYLVKNEYATKPILDEELKAIQDDFLNMPLELQNQFIINDIVMNNISGKEALSQLFPPKTVENINNALNRFNSNLTLKEKNKIKDAFIRQEITKNNNQINKIFLGKDLYQDDVILGITENMKLPLKIALEKTDIILEIARENSKHKFKGTKEYYKISKTPKDFNENIKKTALKVYKELGAGINPYKSYNFKPNKNYTLDKIERTIKRIEIRKHIENNIKRYYPNSTTNDYKNIDLISGFAENITNQLHNNDIFDIFRVVYTEATPIDRANEIMKDIIKQSNQPKKKIKGRESREIAQNLSYTTGDKILSQEEYENIYKYKIGTTKEIKKEIYHNYKVQKEEANKLFKTKYSPENINKMNDDELNNLYKHIYGKDYIAYGNIIDAWSRPYISKIINTQSNVTNVKEGDKDISIVKSMFQSADTTAKHPGTQAIAKELETQNKIFMAEKTKYFEKINKATEKIYDDFFGKHSNNNFINRLARAAQLLFTNKKKIYQALYGELINTVTENGTKKHILLPEIILKEKLKDKKITKSQYEFAKLYREIVKDLSKNAKKTNFVANVGMGRMEMFSNKGLLGLLSMTRAEDQRIWDVKMTYQGEVLPYKTIHDIMKAKYSNNLNKATEYIKYMMKAKKLMKKGINEDGTRLEISNVMTKTLMGDGMINRFINNEAEFKEDEISMDLNKSLHEYMHTALFVDGNKNFKGFEKLQSLVDALIIHNEMKDFKNQNEYVDKVFKEYWIKGMRRKPIKPRDKVINALVNLNLLYVMGVKLLIGTKGLYAVGNAVIGKYLTLKNKGGKTFILGEKRYFGIGKENPGTRKAQGIMKTLGILDYNVYDQIPMEKQIGLNKIFTDIAFSPMLITENWIQLADYLGHLTEEEWNKFDDNGHYKEGTTQIPIERVNHIERKVRQVHGEGYSNADQRLIQQYSWGRAMMQFSRFIPTTIADRFKSADVDKYGEKTIGSLNALSLPIRKVLTGEMNMKDTITWYKKQDKVTQERFKAGLRGVGLITLAYFFTAAMPNETTNQLIKDINIAFGGSKLRYRAEPPILHTISNILLPYKK